MRKMHNPLLNPVRMFGKGFKPTQNHCLEGLHPILGKKRSSNGVNKVFSCFLSYLIVITPSVGANLAFSPGQTHRFAPTITYAAKPSTHMVQGTSLQSIKKPMQISGKPVKQETAYSKKVRDKIHSLQVPFIENKGQIGDEGVRYYAKTFGGTVFITKDGELVYSLPFNSNQQLAVSLTPKNLKSQIPNPKSAI